MKQTGTFPDGRMGAGGSSEDDGSTPASRLLASLSTVHAAALILDAAGVPDERRARLLGVPVESLATLLDVARRKAWRVVGAPMDRRRPEQAVIRPEV